MPKLSKDETIKKYMEKLSLTKEEATQLYNDEKKMDSKSEGNVKQPNAKAQTVYKFNPPKKRPPDEDKKTIVSEVQNKIKDIGGEIVEVINPEREFKFTLKGTIYKLTLSKPRVKKEV